MPLNSNPNPTTTTDTLLDTNKDSLPAGWPLFALEDVADIVSGVGFPKSSQGRTKGDYPFAKVSDISQAVLHQQSQLSRAENYVVQADLKALHAKPIPVGAVVFAKIGEALRLNRRAYTQVEVLLDNNCMALIARPERLNSRYLFYFMRTVDLSPLAVATAVPSVRRGDVAGLAIPLPPLEEQARIVAKLDTLFANTRRARQELVAVPKLVERYKQALLTAAFSGQYTAKWPTLTLHQLASAVFDGPFGSNLKSNDYTDSGTQVVRLENIGHLNFIGEKQTFISDTKYLSH